MKRSLNMWIWIISVCILSGILLGGGFLLVSTLGEYKPGLIEPAGTGNLNGPSINTRRQFTLISWNIGYGGLGSRMDFFYDGGRKVRPEKAYFRESWGKIVHFLREHDSVDFFLLQEVDRNAKRSYYTDEMAWLIRELPGFCMTFGINYNSRFVPVPFFRPLGRVVSGVVSFSRFRPDSSTRHGFDKHKRWPKGPFHLKRCFLVNRFNLPGENQLVIVNIHNSAFDAWGRLRRREMEMIRDFMMREYAHGNYLVAGGDWNVNPPGFRPDEIQSGDQVRQIGFPDIQGYFPGWKFVYDPGTPTNRDVDTPYEAGVTPTTITDFFLVSPNVTVQDFRTFLTGFEGSDHQPVLLKIVLP